jgi:hypothetical protein
MLLTRLLEVLLEWLTTGRFPREELRVHPMLLVLGVVVVGPVIVALILQALG